MRWTAVLNLQKLRGVAGFKYVSRRQIRWSIIYFMQIEERNIENIALNRQFNLKNLPLPVGIVPSRYYLPTWVAQSVIFPAFASSELISMTFLINCNLFPPTASELCWYRTHTVNMKDSANFLMGTYSYMQVFIIRLSQTPNFSYMHSSFSVTRLWPKPNFNIFV